MGILAKQKDDFDTLRRESEEIRKQVLGRFTEGIGLEQFADTAKMQTYLNNLNKHTADTDRRRLKEYSEGHQKLLTLIRDKFEPVDLSNTPREIRIALNEKLARLNHMGVDDPRLATGDFREAWGERLNDLKGFFEDTDKELADSLQDINDKLPIARALVQDQGKSANMNQSVRDFTRGSAAGAAVFALTGSSQLAMAAGVLSGTVGVAQNPKQLVALINQLRSTRIASQKMVGEYLDDWASNQVPKAAIHKGWEHKSRQALFVTAAAITKDRSESTSDIRSRAAKNRSIDSWTDKIGIALDAEVTDENFYDARNSIEQLSKSPMLMDRFLKEVTGPFDGTPEIQRAMKVLIKKHISIAKRAIPPTTQATIFGDEYPPTPQQLAEFQRILQVLTDPTETILTAMLTGTITKNMVKTLNEAWPQIYADIADKALELVKSPDLSQGQKQTLATLLGMNYANPEELSRLQKPYVPDEEGKRKGGNDMSSLTSSFSQGTMAYVRQG